jgi:hypothetical protein
MYYRNLLLHLCGLHVVCVLLAADLKMIVLTTFSGLQHT